MTEQAAQPIFNIIRIERVVEKTGLSKSTICKEVARGKFPQPVPLSRRCVGWLTSEVDAWIKQRLVERAVVIAEKETRLKRVAKRRANAA